MADYLSPVQKAYEDGYRDGYADAKKDYGKPSADVAPVPRWIPVTERLPEPNAVDEYGFAKGYLVKTDRHVMMHTARYNGEWWILWGKAEVITDTVTHWMPLPEPPVEVNE